ncbi:hypothetical protein [Oxynema aestuarii]|jgi:hypothetical protein|uniref:Uncharacterized protein n=1 Tax=Oxynema aestuarii AP17 TaxID=2064643 RepID=A0A6H1U1A5_9CYAN|nr:hypothetical protein [Oxynema aestuarii]QIZ72658.1 hypothetical protein HCG48_20385 [Oxynema aestuarii AP17]RMH74668.1 MAG: hypothetical protein D6680_14050 [Cyanobacteria bacterium J007]
MIVSDLSYCELAHLNDDLQGGAITEITISGLAIGEFTKVVLETGAFAVSLPYGASVSFSSGVGISVAVNLPDIPSFSLR